MSDPRMTGLALMGLSIAAFLGTTTQTLPSVMYLADQKKVYIALVSAVGISAAGRERESTTRTVYA